nr:ABC transporter permease [Methylomarinum sp. Ch1-1]MDP4519775.1 ABC transporter permease [Methylomarinum sp. Ch1-1]
MNNIQTIPLQNLAFILIPVLAVLVILFKWGQGAGHASYAILRMLVQLLLIGYVLNYLFASNSAPVTLLILAVMIIFSSWIALGTVKSMRNKLLWKAMLAVLTGED